MYLGGGGERADIHQPPQCFFTINPIRYTVGLPFVHFFIMIRNSKNSKSTLACELIGKQDD